MHTISGKKKLLDRIKRLRGQLDGLERAVESEAGCDDVLHRLAGVRGALGGLMAEVVEDHVKNHLVVDGKRGAALDEQAVERLLEVVHSYVR